MISTLGDELGPAGGGVGEGRLAIVEEDLVEVVVDPGGGEGGRAEPDVAGDPVGLVSQTAVDELATSTDGR